MHVLIVGAAGMVGRKLTDRLVQDGKLGGRELARLTLTDVVEPAKPQGFGGQVVTDVSDLSTPGAAAKLAALRPDTIFHLAAIVAERPGIDRLRRVPSRSVLIFEAWIRNSMAARGDANQCRTVSGTGSTASWPASGSRRMPEKNPEAALLGLPGRIQMVGRRTPTPSR